MIALSLLALLVACFALYDQNQILREIRQYNLDIAGVREDLEKVLKARPVVDVEELENPPPSA